MEPIVEGCPVDVCEKHALVLVAFMKERGGAVMRRMDAIYEEPPVSKGVERRPPIYVGGRASVVYYMKFGQHVKIGFSTNLPSRARDLKPEAVIAVEPGARGEETTQHLRFLDKRVHGEFFQLDHELIQYINMVRATYGDPFEAVASWNAAVAA